MTSAAMMHERQKVWPHGAVTGWSGGESQQIGQRSATIRFSASVFCLFAASRVRASSSVIHAIWNGAFT